MTDSSQASGLPSKFTPQPELVASLGSSPPLLLLQEDDCAPDAWESFAAKLPLHSGGLSVEKFKRLACREDFDDGFATCWRLGQLTLSVSADDPFYSLHRIPLLTNPTSEGDLDD